MATSHPCDFSRPFSLDIIIKIQQYNTGSKEHLINGVQTLVRLSTDRRDIKTDISAFNFVQNQLFYDTFDAPGISLQYVQSMHVSCANR